MLLVRVIACFAAIAVAAGCHSSSDKAGGSGHAPSVVLRFASIGGFPQAPVQAWIDAVERRSRGSIRIDLQQSWRRGDPRGEEHTLRDLRSGRVDLAWVGARVFDRVGVKSFQPLMAPFLVDSYPLEARVFADPLVRRTLTRARLPGVVVLGVLPGPMRRLAGFAHPFTQPSDFRGQIVGLQDSALSTASLRLLGAVPRATAGAVPVSGLDGYEQQLSSFVGNGFDQSAKYVTANVDLWPRPLVIAAGVKALARLTPAQRTLLREAMSGVSPTVMQQAAREDVAATSAICRTQMRQATASAHQLALLRTSVAPIYRALAADPETGAVLARIESLKRATGAPPATMLPCAALVGARASDRETPVDGRYELSLRASDLPAATRLPELYGRWQIVLDHGRFRLTQGSDGANWIADGSVRVSGDSMTWRVSDAYDESPHGAPDGTPLQPGDQLSFRWQRSAGQLDLRSLDARPRLPSLGVRALRRIGDAPGQQRLVDPTPLFGTWTVTITAQDFLDHHADPNGIQDNSGPMTLTIGGSRCSWSQRAPSGPGFTRGTCRFAGNTLELDWSATDPKAATAPYFFEWSVFHDRLTLRRSPGFSPDGWAYHPWRRKL
jgi:TRAP-type C4-dicarboxylate transport system substrate-binding protein